MLTRAAADLPADGDPLATGQALIDRGAFLTGDADRIVARIAEYAEAGAGEVVINATGVLVRYGTDAAIADLREILMAAGHYHPAA
jgi:alkanesulfonate monooxygenase SsuD/methylene tetrahydromethanopterin reductase-like flavin-dependent oxidoreductase (luciferase family)